MKREEILLVYDRECPACNTYCQVVNIRKDVGDLRIVDARENSEVMDEITSQGLDIDQGMVLKWANNFTTVQMPFMLWHLLAADQVSSIE